MPDEIVILTPEQEAIYNAASNPVGPEGVSGIQEINPLKDLTADQISELAIRDSDNFDISSEFVRQKDLHSDPEIVQKTADALHAVRQRGFKLSDLPGPGKIARTVGEVAKGFGKQAFNYLTAAVNTAVAMGSDLAGGKSDVSDELLREAQRRVVENIAGTEASVSGLAEQGIRGAKNIGRGLGITKPLEDFTPEEKVQELWKSTGQVQTQQEIAKGKGAFLTGVGGEVVKGLEEAGKPVRPEEVETLAAGDPFAWWTFGKALSGTGKLIPAGAGKVAEKAGEITTAAGGKTIQALGEATKVGAKVAGKVAPVVGAIKGGIEAGPLGVLAGAKTGEIAQAGARKVAVGGEKLAGLGAEIAAKEAPASAIAQLGKDVFHSLPGVAGGFAHGAAIDLGLAAASSETPRETEAAGLGAALGTLGGVRKAGQRILSGQLIAPRKWGTPSFIPSSGQFPALDSMHSESYKTAPPAVQERVNAIRQFAQSSSGADVFFGKDSEVIRKALLDAGVNPSQADLFSQQSGFFTADLPAKNGTTRRVVVINNPEAAPHESFHAIQDVLGEQANRSIDELVKSEYSDRWDAEGQRYAQRLAGKPVENWRDVVLESSGWGTAEAVEKLSQEAGNQIRNATGAEPNPAAVKDLVRGAWSQIPGDPKSAWREILTSDEQAATADRYIAREIAAENFDAVFKNLGSSLKERTGILPKLARIVGKTVEALGGEPLASRVSEFGEVPLSFPVTEAVKGAARKPLIEPKPGPAKPEVKFPGAPPTNPADEAKTIADSASEEIQAGGTKSPKELLGEIAAAIAQRTGVKINYLSAPGEPAAATTSNRPARREIIEAFRSLPPEARALWEKNFFPERVIKLKGDKYQVLGWSPEVFASNAHKLADALAKTGNEALSPYPIDVRTRSFTTEGWKALFDDTQKFVQNQIAGQTGAGQELVVPQSVTERGFFAPPVKPSAGAPVNQRSADFINLLFGFKLPETPRLQKGKLPLNLAGQEVSIATQPGRIRKPTVARAPFAGEEAERQNIEGREILEVNPLRADIEAALKTDMPSLIEAQQRLALENIKEVSVTPEQPEFRGNTLTLTAGFQPMPEERRAIRSAAVRFNDGKIYEGPAHFIALDQAAREGKTRTDTYDSGFVTNDGEFLDRDAAFRRAEELGQAPQDTDKRLRSNSIIDLDTAQFQPAKDAMESLKNDTEWDKIRSWPKGKLGGGLTGWAFEQGAAAKTPEDLAAFRSANETFSNLSKEAMANKNFDLAMSYMGRAQAAHEAYQAATGQNFKDEPQAVPFIRDHYDKAYQPPLPGEAFKRSEAGPPEEMKIAAQPKKANDPYKFLPGSMGGFSKSWILPNGTPVQLGGQWHHHWLAEDPEGQAFAKKYGLKIPAFEGTDTEGVREEAIKKGFARVNYGVNNGTLTVEARAKDWRKLKNSVQQMVESNLDNVDNMQVYLYDDNVKKIVDQDFARLFNYDGPEKLEHLPLISGTETRGQFQPAKFSDKGFDEELKKVQSGKSSGQTFNPDGTVWKASEPSDIVTLASVNIPQENLNRETFTQAVEPYAELLSKPGIAAGVFSFPKEGSPTVSIDINAIVPKEFRDNSVAFAKANDQISIWDADAGAEVKTGGAGNTRLKSPEDLSAAAESLVAGKPVNVKAITGAGLIKPRVRTK